jgi:hypothetical protein
MSWSQDQMAARAAHELQDGFLCQSWHWHTYLGGQPCA